MFLESGVTFTQEFALNAILVTFAGGCIAYIKFQHDRMMRLAQEGFQKERDLYDKQIADLKSEGAVKDKYIDMVRRETMALIESFSYSNRLPKDSNEKDSKD